MSMGVLLQAVRDRLKTALGLDDTKIDINETGRPPAFAGEEFWVVHPGAFNNTSVQSLDERYDVSVTYNRRTEYAPDDRSEDWLVAKTAGVYDRVATARAALHMDYGTLDLCGGTKSDTVTAWTGGQAYSLPNTVMGFREPLFFSMAHAPADKGPEWFWAEPADEGSSPVGGVAVQMDFLGARRTQNITGQS